jgi:hypothetical protein
VHRRAVAIGDTLEKHLIRRRLSSNDALACRGVDGDDVLHDRLPVTPLVRRFLPESVNEPKFPDFCTKREKWFRAWGDLFRRRLRDETYAAKL